MALSGADSQIASVSIGTTLDISGVLRDVEKLQSRLRQQNKLPALTPRVNDLALVELNKHFKLKERDYLHLKRVIESNPLTPKVKSSELDGASAKLRSLQSQIASLKSASASSINLNTTVTKTEKVYREVKERSRVEGTAQQSQAKALRASNDEVVKGLEKVSRAVRKTQTGFFGNVIRGAQESLGETVSKGLRSSLKKNFGLDAFKSTEKLADALASPIKGVLVDNPQLKQAANKFGIELDNRLRKVWYKAGDALVAGLDADGNLQSKLSAVLAEAFNADTLKEELKGAFDDFLAYSKQARYALVENDYVKGKLGGVDERLRNYRVRALQERAIPLVQQRALEILGQKRAKNSANLVTDSTKEFVVTTGGYAGARGLSGHRIAQELGKEMGENAVAVWIKNTDTDIPQASMGRASAKAVALASSLGKPNLRGYSNDSIEMAAQALAALEKNPEITIKFVGESGGGFVAEEAAKILELMGIDKNRFTYMGIGTPNFIGGLNAHGKKIISPDEYLGAETARFYERLGLAKGGKDQRILGVEGHPYEHYKEAGIAEVQNLIYNSPGQLSRDEIAQIKDASEQFKAQDTSELDSRQLQHFSEMAFKNLQQVRRYALEATEETRDELEAIAKNFEDAYIKTAPEGRDFTQVRAVVKQAQDLLVRLKETPGLEAKGVALQVVKELKQYQKEFADKNSRAVGTVGEKFKSIDEEFDNLIKEFANPALAIKVPAPKPPEVKLPEPEPPSPPAKVEPDPKAEAMESAKAEALKQSFTDRVHALAKAVGIESIRPPAIDTSEAAQARLKEYGATGGYESAQNAILLTRKRLEEMAKNFGSVASELSQSDLEETIGQLSTLAHELYHSLQYGFSGLDPVALAKAGRIYAPDIAASEAEAARFKQLRGYTPEENAEASRRAVEGSPDYKALSPEEQKLRSQQSYQLEMGAYSFQSKFLHQMFEQLQDGTKTVQQAFEASLESLAKELAEMQRQTQASAAVLDQSVPEKIEAITETVAQEMKAVVEAAEEAVAKTEQAIEAVAPVPQPEPAQQSQPEPIAPVTPPQPVKSTQQRIQTDAERAMVAHHKEFEQIATRNIARYHNPDAGITPEELDQYLGKVLDQIFDRITQLEELQKEGVASETQAAYGETKTQLEQIYRQYSQSDRMAEAIKIVQAQAKANEPEPDERAIVEANLKGYTAEILRELSRLSGRGVTKRKKDEIVEDLIQNVKPEVLQETIDAITPLIERGPRGGMKLQRVQQSDAERVMLEKQKEFEQITARNIARYHDPDKGVTAEQLDQYLGKVLDQVAERIAELDKLQQEVLSPETRMAYGQTKGRLEQVYRQYSPQLRVNQAQQNQSVSNQATNKDIRLARVNMLSVSNVAQETYEAVMRSVAKASKQSLQNVKLPSLVIDNEELEKAGVEAMYDIKNNVIVINEQIAEILKGGASTLEENAEKLKALVHEARHAAQLEFGQKTLDDIAEGRASIQMVDPRKASQSARYYAAKSVKATQKAGAALTPAQKRASYGAEVDAYEFEQNTPQILARAAKEMQSGSVFERLQQAFASMHEGGQSLPIVGQLGALVNMAGAAVNGVKQLTTTVLDLAQTALEGTPLEKGFAALRGGIEGVIGNTKLLVAAFVGFKALQVIGQLVNQFAGSIIEAGSQLEVLKNRFKFTFAGDGLDKFQEVSQRAIDMRQNLNDTRESYLQFASAVKSTPLEYITDSAQSALGKASLQQGLNREQQQLVQRAIIQSAGKGQLYSEEVFGQLAESMPNAPAVLARSLGTDVAGLRSKMESGLPAESALPKFFAQLEAESSLGIDSALDTTTAKAANLENQIQMLKESLGEKALGGQKLGLDLLANSISLLNNILPGLIAAIGIQAVAALAKFTLGLKLNVGTGRLASLAWAGMGKAAKGFVSYLGQSANSIDGFALGISGAIEIYKVVSKAFEDAGGEARKFADDVNKAADKYNEALDKMSQGTKKRPGESLIENFFGIGGIAKTVGGDAGLDAVRGWEQNIQENPLGKLADMTPYGVLKYLLPEKYRIKTPQGLQFRTFERKQSEDRTIAMNDALAASSQTGSEMFTMLQSAKTGGGPLAQLRQYQNQIRDLQTQRRLLMPGQSDQRRAIDEQIAQISQTKSQPEQQVRMLAARQATVVEGLKRLRDEAEKMGDTNAYARYTAELNNALKVQEQFNKALEGSVKSVEALQTEFERIQGQLTESNRAIDAFAAQTRQGIAGNTALTEGQRSYAQSIAQQEELMERIAATQRALQQNTALLRDPETQRLLNASGFSESSSPAEIRAKTKLTGNAETEEGKRLMAAADQIDTVQQQNLDVQNFQTQIVEAQQQAREQLKQTSRQVADFYRQMTRSAQDMQFQIKDLNLTAFVNRTKAALKQGMNQFSDSFFADFTSTFLDMMDGIFEHARETSQAQQQKMGVYNQMIDSRLSAQDLQQSAYQPGGQSVGFSPYQVHKEYFIDDSPVGSYDFTLEQNGNYNPALPSPVSGVVTEAGTDAGYGNYVAIKDAASGQEWFFAHLKELGVQAGQAITEGMSLGLQGTTGSSTGEHVHAEIWNRARSEGGSRITDRSITQPMVEAYIAKLESGSSGSSAPTAQAQPQAQMQVPSGPQYRPRGGPVGVAERVQADPAGAAAILATAQRLHLDPYQLAALMSWESAGTLNPNVTGGDGGAYQGLIQFSPDNQSTYGIRPNMSIAEQMPVVERYLLDRGFKPGQMDIRGAYSAILAGNASERYWDEPDSNGTTVRNAAGKFSSGDHFERGRQFLNASGASVPNAGMPVTGGGAGGQNPMVNQALARSEAMSGQYTQSIDAALEASKLLGDTDYELQVRQQRDRLLKAQESVSDTVRGQQQQQQDILLQGLSNAGTTGQGLVSLLQSNRSMDQSTLEMQRTLRQLERSVQDQEENKSRIAYLQQNRDRIIAAGGDAGRIDQQIGLLPDIQKSLDSTRASLEQAQASFDRQASVYQQSQQEVIAEQKRQDEVTLKQGQLRTDELRGQYRAGRIRDPQFAQFQQSQLEQIQIGQNYDEQIRPLREEIARTNEQIAKLKENGIELNSEQAQFAADRISTLNEQIAQLNEQRSIELDIKVNERNMAVQQIARDMQAQVVAGVAGYRNRRGDVYGANQLQRDYNVGLENERYSQQVAAIQASGLPTDQMGLLLTQAQQLRDVNIDGFISQFPDLGETLEQTAHGSLANFGSILGDVLTTAQQGGDVLETLKQGFLSLANSIVSTLAQEGIKALLSGTLGGGGIGGLFGGNPVAPPAPTFADTATSIFGSFLGAAGGFAGGGGAAAGTLDSVMGFISASGYMSEGGHLPGYGGGDTEPTMLEKGEFVLRKEAVKAIGVPNLHKMNQKKIGYYSTGGEIGGSRYRPSYDAESDYRGRSGRQSEPIKYEVTKINSMNFVTESQFHEGMQRASETGAKRGYDLVSSDLRNNPNKRKSWGV